MESQLKLSNSMSFPYKPCPNAQSAYGGRSIWQTGILGESGAAIITIVAGATTVNLNHPGKWEVYPKAHVGEITIPGRQGGQTQYLGRAQYAYTVSGVIDADTELTGANGYQALETIQASATNATLTLVYNGNTLKSDTVRITEYPYWVSTGSKMPWYFYTMKALAIG